MRRTGRSSASWDTGESWKAGMNGGRMCVLRESAADWTSWWSGFQNIMASCSSTMHKESFFDKLYALQDEVLRVINGAGTEFYLTGGTAASRGYLNHRFSEDLDLFVNDDDRFSAWADRVVQSLIRH